MNNKDRLEVGLRGFLKPINNQARWGNRKHEQVTVTKIGRKYFEVEKDDFKGFPITFKIEDLFHKSDYSPDWKFYFDEQHLLDEQEHVMLTKHMRNLFAGYSDTVLTLEKLRKIHAIIVDKSKE